MKVLIDKSDILPEGEYELTDARKLENAKGNIPFPQSGRRILVEYDRIGGRLLKDNEVLPPQSVWKAEQIHEQRAIETFTDEELQTIIRCAENTDISGSLYQRASNEWKLRQDLKLLKTNTREKWRHDYLPMGYPQDCSDDQIRQVIQDLSEEKSIKLLNGKVNIIWEKILDDYLKNGREELSHRRGVRHWYEKPLGTFILGVLTTVVGGYILFKLDWI
jgi:hypothetical protein